MKNRLLYSQSENLLRFSKGKTAYDSENSCTKEIEKCRYPEETGRQLFRPFKNVALEETRHLDLEVGVLGHCLESTRNLYLSLTSVSVLDSRLAVSRHYFLGVNVCFDNTLLHVGPGTGEGHLADTRHSDLDLRAALGMGHSLGTVGVSSLGTSDFLNKNFLEDVPVSAVGLGSFALGLMPYIGLS
jgi:hypothetical protein